MYSEESLVRSHARSPRVKQVHQEIELDDNGHDAKRGTEQYIPYCAWNPFENQISGPSRGKHPQSPPQTWGSVSARTRRGMARRAANGFQELVNSC